MKIIDLLNKIANGEEVPLKIEYNGEVYNREKNKSNGLYYYEVLGKGKFLMKQLLSVGDLLDEVKILDAEEKKIPEKLKWNEKSQHNVVTDNTKKTLEHLLSRSEQLKKSINDIVDYLKSKGEDE